MTAFIHGHQWESWHSADMHSVLSNLRWERVQFTDINRQGPLPQHSLTAGSPCLPPGFGFTCMPDPTPGAMLWGTRTSQLADDWMPTVAQPTRPTRSWAAVTALIERWHTPSQPQRATPGMSASRSKDQAEHWDAMACACSHVKERST